MVDLDGAKEGRPRQRGADLPGGGEHRPPGGGGGRHPGYGHGGAVSLPGGQPGDPGLRRPAGTRSLSGGRQELRQADRRGHRRPGRQGGRRGLAGAEPGGLYPVRQGDGGFGGPVPDLHGHPPGRHHERPQPGHAGQAQPGRGLPHYRQRRRVQPLGHCQPLRPGALRGHRGPVRLHRRAGSAHRHHRLPADFREEGERPSPRTSWTCTFKNPT